MHSQRKNVTNPTAAIICAQYNVHTKLNVQLLVITASLTCSLAHPANRSESVPGLVDTNSQSIVVHLGVELSHVKL